MAEPQLSVRSAKAIEIAHRLARAHNRTVAKTVERALELLDAQEGNREPVEEFYRRLAENGVDFDILELTKDLHKPHPGIDL
nr:plasmid stabilization protein [Mesorhizobium sp.]